MHKLLQINIVANWGSTGRITEDIGQIAMANGWESYIAYGRGNPKSTSNLIRIGNNVDMYFHVLQSRILDNHGLSSQKATRYLIKQIDGIKPDIIHLHNIHGYYINYKILFEYLAKIEIPIIWTLHDCWSFTGHCAYFDYIKCNKWKIGCSKCPQISSYPRSLIRDRSLLNYKQKKECFTSVKQMTFVPVSNWLGNLLHESYLSSYPICRIYNGIDLSVFYPVDGQNVRVKLGNEKSYLILGVASVWDRRKGLDDFLKLRELSSEEYLIILIGLNRKQIENLPSGIIGIERTNNINELVEYYSAADVFVNPTWEDTFPTTNLESLACGTPVITYKTGGSPEAIDEKTGAVIETGNIKELAKAVVRICKETDRNMNLKICRDRAERLFNKNDRFQEYMDLYKKIVL